MKSIIEFNLPEEREEMNDALNGNLYKVRIDTLYDEVFRPHLKYVNPILQDELTDEEYTIIKTIWEKVFNHFEDCLDD